MHAPIRSPAGHGTFTTNKINRSAHLPFELKRLAKESLALFGHPDAPVEITSDSMGLVCDPKEVYTSTVGGWVTRVGLTVQARHDGDAMGTWSLIMAFSALTTDRWFLKTDLAALGAGVAVLGIASKLPIRMRWARLATATSASLATSVGILSLAERHSILRADDRVTDALMAAGLKQQMGEYIDSTRNSTLLMKHTFGLLPVPTERERLSRMRERLAEKWNMEVVSD